MVNKYPLELFLMNNILVDDVENDFSIITG